MTVTWINGLSRKLMHSAWVCIWIGAWTVVPLPAEMYKYQKNGVWHFTDTPTDDMPTERQQLQVSGRTAPAPTAEAMPLLADYPARNPIERAAAATLAVKSAWGFGSGFFISEQGHIVTNRHVLRSLEKDNRENEARFKEIESRIAGMDQSFADEHRRLQLFKERLEQIRAELETHPPTDKLRREEYQAQQRRYEDWRSDLDKRFKAYEQEKNTFRDGRRDYDYRRSVADLAQSFTVILADGTESYARLIRVSTDHDLALLKLDGYRTPTLIPGTSRVAQSDPVYAIGSPAQLQNSVTSGVFSGYEQGFLKTNAQIYPGNSGGPLVCADGRVLGINTFKQLTHKFEGLGFAIPIQTALKEFSAHLP
jgi:serine protease Do